MKKKKPTRWSVAKWNRKIEEALKKYQPPVIKVYEENGVVIKRYEAR